MRNGHRVCGNSIAISIVGAALLLAANSARGELLYFRDGGRVQAPAVLEGGRVRVDTPLGRFLFPEEAFTNIVPGHDPEREWEVRRKLALADDAEARLRTAWWALRHGLVDEAEELIRSARETPSTDPIIPALNALLDQLDTPRPDADDSALREALAIRLKTRPGRLVSLLHQDDESRALARREHLERVARAFYLWFGFHGVILPPPKNRLVFVQLAARSDYARFLSEQNAGAFADTQGYFHPTFRVVLSCEPPDSETPNSKGVVDDARARARLLKACEREAIQLGIATHEMVHLLVVASGLDPDSTRFPLWLHEGLAAQFEVVRGGRWAGIGLAHDIRLMDWRSATAPPALTSVIVDQGFGQGYRKQVYASSWSLVNFLGASRPKEFVALIDALRLPDEVPDRDRSARSEACFRRVFGEDLASLETEWRAYMAALKTPLESCDPSNHSQNPRRRD